MLVCVKDRDKHVLYQNKACHELCGDMESESGACEKHCMPCYVSNEVAPDREEGTQYCPNEQIEGKFYDILFVNDGDNLTTFLYPLNGRQEADLRHVEQYNLTKREQEIIKLVIEGNTNAEMAKKLFVSKATVKKHLNNIYKKIPENIFPR